jgi:hypothetical protein
LFLLQFEIVFFNADGEYEGDEFSITGKMSELQIVFLNRFIQEVHMPPSAVIAVFSVHKKRKTDFYRFCLAILLIDQI